MLSNIEQKNFKIIHILSDIYDSDKVDFVKSISEILSAADFENSIILPKSVLAGNLKRSGSETIILKMEIRNKKGLLNEIKTIIKKHSRQSSNLLVHNHESGISKEIQDFCKKNNIHSAHSIFSKPKGETLIRKALGRSSLFVKEMNISTTSEELKKYLLRNYTTFISSISVVPVEISDSNVPVPHERIIALAKSWGILDQPSLILLTQEFYGNKVWENHIFQLGKILENLKNEQSIQLVIQDSKKENPLREKFQENLIQKGLLTFVNPVRESSDFEAAVSIASIFLDLSPDPPETSLVLQRCAQQGKLCIAWKHGANIEAFSDKLSESLVEPFNFTIFAQKIRKFLLQGKEQTKVLEEKNQKHVQEKYTRKAVELALFDFYNKTLDK